MDEKKHVIQQVADELESLKNDRQTEADDCERAGRYIRQAIEAGAFSGPERIKLKSQVNHYLNKSSSNPRYSKDISGWAELRHWLRMAEGLPTDGELEDTFIEDIDLAVSALRADVDEIPVPKQNGDKKSFKWNKTRTLIIAIYSKNKTKQKFTETQASNQISNKFSEYPANIGREYGSMRQLGVMKNDDDKKGFYLHPNYLYLIDEAPQHFGDYGIKICT